MLMTDLRRAIDPVSIATDVGLSLDPWQAVNAGAKMHRLAGAKIHQ
jgi:hypothetical protein